LLLISTVWKWRRERPGWRLSGIVLGRVREAPSP
jgi:hypothetical protein